MIMPASLFSEYFLAQRHSLTGFGMRSEMKIQLHETIGVGNASSVIGQAFRANECLSQFMSLSGCQ
jgi:hypothetical protein